MSFVPQVVTRNWRLKLAAFGLAVFLWAVVRGTPGGTDTITSVPVLVEVSPLDWTLAGLPNPASVEVRFSGTLRDLPGLGQRGPVLRVPIDSVSSTDTIVQLERDWVVAEGRPGLIVRDIAPPQVRLTFERTRTAALPLSLPTVNDLPESSALAQPLALNPQVVRVRGRVSQLAALDSIRLRPLDLSSLDGSGQYAVDVDTSGLGDLTFLTAPQATVSVRLEEAVSQRFTGVPVRVPLPQGVDSATLTVQPGEVEVTLRGGRTRVGQTLPAELRAVVPDESLAGMAPGDARTVPIRVRGVPDLVRAYSTMDSVRVRWLLPEQGRPSGGGAATPPDSAVRDSAVRDTASAGGAAGGGGDP